MVNVAPSARRTALKYVAGTAIGLLIVAAGVYFYVSSDQAPQTAVQAPEVTTANTTPTARKQADFADEPLALSSLTMDQARELVGLARRLAASGDFAAAQAALKKADQVAPGWDETAEARREIAALNTPQGQLAAQLERARSAVDRGDNSAAEQAISEAERLNAPAQVIAELRGDLRTAQQEDARKDGRIASLLKEMRAAAARQDFAAANRALNEAARIDIQSHDVLLARDELRREQDSVKPPVKN